MKVGELIVAIGADISDFDKKIGGIGKKMSSVGKSMSMSLTAPLLLAAAAGVKMASDVEKGLREVNTLLADSDKDFAGLQKGVESLSNEIGIAQDTLTKGLYSAISAGVPKDNVFEFMEVAAKAGIAGVTDTETAIDGITTTINAFGLDISKAGAVADSMFAAVQGGKTTFEELSSSMSNVAGTAAASKIPFTEINAALATLTSAGTPTSQAANQVRAAISAMQKPTEGMTKVFTDLNFASAQQAIESKGLGFALNAVKEASGGSNGALLKLLGTEEAVAAANILAGTGAAKFTAEMDRQANSAGATQGAFEEMEKSNSRAMEKMSVGIGNAGIAIGNILLPFVAKLASMISGVVGWFTSLDASTKKWIVGIAAVVAAIGPLLLAMGFFITTIAPAMGAAWAVAMGPVGWVIGGIALLTVAFIAFQDEIIASVDAIIEGFKAIPQAIMDAFGGMGKILKAIFTGDFAAIPSLLKEVGSNILKSNPFAVIGAGVAKGFTKEVGDTIEDELPKEVKKSEPVIDKEFGDLGTVAGKSFATEANREAIQWWEKKPMEMLVIPKFEGPKNQKGPKEIDVPEAPDMGGDMADGFAGGLVNFFQGPLVSTLMDAGAVIGKAIGKAFTASKELAVGMSQVFTGAMDSFGGSFDALISGDFVGAIVGIFSDFASQSEAFGTLMKSLNTIISKVMASFMPVFDKLVVAMTPLIGIVDVLAEMMSNTLMVLLGAITEPLISILSLFTELVPVITELTNSISGALGKVLQMVFKSFKSFLPVVLTMIEAFIGIIDPLMLLFTVISDMLLPVLQAFNAIIGGAITASLLILAPILELIAMSLKPLVPIFELIALSMMPIIILFDLLAKGIEWLLGKLGISDKGSPLEGDQSLNMGIPALAKGGIVNGPTTALIGEAGPEAVIPLSKLGGMTGGGNVTFKIAGTDLIGVIDNASTNNSRIG